MALLDLHVRPRFSLSEIVSLHIIDEKGIGFYFGFGSHSFRPMMVALYDPPRMLICMSISNVIHFAKELIGQRSI